VDESDEKKLFILGHDQDDKRRGFCLEMEYLLQSGVIKSVGDIWYSFIHELIYYLTNI
jgi:hypothetical protein